MTHDVVVLGAGYAGLVAAKRLARQLHDNEVAVTLVSAFPDFVERPRLHQLATGQRIERTPLAKFLDRTPVRLVIGAVVAIDLDGKSVTVADGGGVRRELGYDTLVYALGSNIDTGSVPGVAEHAANLVGTDAAADLHARLGALTLVGGTVAVCGGGLTGIEIATEVAESFPTLKVTLVSGQAPGHHLSDKARTYLAHAFDDLGILMRTGRRVAEVQDGRLLTDGAAIPFDICVWAGGFRVPALAKASGLATNVTGRAVVDSTLQSVSHPGVYVIGDAAAVPGAWGDEIAMGCRSGGFTGPKLADILAARLTGREPRPFAFRYYHECISLGRKHGLVQFLNADESPKNKILTGRKAIVYKNLVLNSAKLVFRRPGPFPAHRRHLAVVPTPIDSRRRARRVTAD
jgi:NADH dehydrogenase FAD-containing subunit